MNQFLGSTRKKDHIIQEMECSNSIVTGVERAIHEEMDRIQVIKVTETDRITNITSLHFYSTTK